MTFRCRVSLWYRTLLQLPASSNKLSDFHDRQCHAFVWYQQPEELLASTLLNHRCREQTFTPGLRVRDPLSFIIAPLILSPMVACLLWWTIGSRLFRPHLDLPAVRVLRPACAVRGSTVVVVLTVRVLALGPRRRVMRVGLVVLVSVILLRRDERKCMFSVCGFVVWEVADSVVFVLVALDGSVIEDELVDDDGVFVWYVSMNDDSVLGRRELSSEVEVMAIVIENGLER